MRRRLSWMLAGGSLRPGSSPRSSACRLGPLTAIAMASLAGCAPTRPPPPPLAYQGLPVSGSLADALKAGFGDCITDTIAMRCFRTDVRLLDQGPYKAAVDLVGSDGAGGFDQLTLWNDWDQNAVVAVTALLESRGWRSCFTGEGRKGDQAVYTRKGEPVRFSMDLSYFGKRRLRILPAADETEPVC